MATNRELQQAISAIRRLQFEEADSLLSDILATRPDNVQARWLLIQSLESQKKTDSVQEQLRLLLVHVNKDLPAIDRIAGHMRRNRYPLDPVLGAYEQYLVRQPGSATAAFNFAFNLARDGQFAAAINLYERALERGISEPEEVHLNIANIYMDHLHDHDEARTHLQKALTLNPAYPGAYYNLGNLAEQEGNRDEASRNFEHCLQLDPANESALARLADTRKFNREDDPLLQKLVASAQRSTNSDIHFAAGKAHEQLGDFTAAWQHFSRGNALDEKIMLAYDPKKTAAEFDRIKARFTRAWLEQFPGDSAQPVFICGMFRSGSTLLEQMLAAHPAFTAGGESEFFPRLVAKELPGYPEVLDNIPIATIRAWQQEYVEQSTKLFGGSSRLTDKRPDNFLYLGLIKAILPAAQFVVTERDWRDIATSIYSVRLGPSQNYATRLQNIRDYIDRQTDLVDHWATVLGPDLKRVAYEDLVLHTQRTMTALLEWLGEGWDEDCLAFHELQNSVKTASVWQVRERLHSKSIGRWKNYQPYFVEAFGSEFES